MHEQELEVATGDGTMTVFAAHPHAGGPYPVAVLYMDALGYRAQIKENARRFATAGYYCVAPDLFYREGKGLVIDLAKLMGGGDDPEAIKLRQMISGLTPAMVQADTEAMLKTIASDPAAAPGPKVCVGYCMGARFALHMAAVDDAFVAAAGIHPGALASDAPDSPHHELKQVKGELYFAFAEIDREATLESAPKMEAEMARHGIRGTVERIGGAAHGFSMADLPAYNREAAERHFERTLELWRRNLGVPV